MDISTEEEKNNLVSKIELLLSKYQTVEGFERISTSRFKSELEIFMESLPKEPAENCTEAFAKSKMLSNLNLMYRVLLTLPVTSCEAERSFSTFRRLKTYLRSTMTSSRCSNLARMNVHRELVESIETNEIMKAFKEKKSRRLSFITGKNYSYSFNLMLICIFRSSPLLIVAFKDVGPKLELHVFFLDP